MDGTFVHVVATPQSLPFADTCQHRGCYKHTTHGKASIRGAVKNTEPPAPNQQKAARPLSLLTLQILTSPATQKDHASCTSRLYPLRRSFTLIPLPPLQLRRSVFSIIKASVASWSSRSACGLRAGDVREKCTDPCDEPGATTAAVLTGPLWNGLLK